jgi:multidrug efflux pump subunit AcrB
MKSLITSFLKRPLWANMLMIALFVLGYMNLSNMRSSFFPETESARINIKVVYPGTSAIEIEQSVVLPIEKQLRGLSGVEYTSSRSIENFGTVVVQGSETVDGQELLDDVNSAIDRVSPWPAGAEKPRLSLKKREIPGLVITMFADADRTALKKYAERFRDALQDLDGITRVSLSGYNGLEISVELDPLALETYGLKIEDVQAVLKSSNLDLSGGRLRSENEELLIRTYARKSEAANIGAKVLKSMPDGSQVLLSDVATVIERWEDVASGDTYEGLPAVVVIVNQAESEDLLGIAEKTRQKLAEFKEQYPEINMHLSFDATVSLQGRLDLLKENGTIGFVLVFVILAFFLNFRVAFWVAIGIPISFAGMFLIAGWVGITLNVLSAFGMILVIGILVDDAIVVAEQAWQGIEKGLTPMKAVQEGTMKVITPVFTAVLTTIFAFLPFFFLEGALGSMIWQLALVVIGALIFSLVESFFILPVHLAHSKGMTIKNVHPIRKKIEKGYTLFTEGFYGKILDKTLDYKWATLAFAFTAVLFTVGLFGGGFIKTNPFPPMDSESLQYSMSLNPGTPLTKTDSITTLVENRYRKFFEDLSNSEGYPILVGIRKGLGANGLSETGSHTSQLTLQLVKAENRNLTSASIIAQMNKVVKVPSEIQKSAFGAGHWGKPIVISLKSNNLEDLRSAKTLLQKELETYTELKGIVDNDAKGPREVRLQITEQGRSLGFNEAMVAMQVRSAFFSSEVMRFQRGEDEIKLVVRYSDEERQNLDDLDDFILTSPIGSKAPLSEIATYQLERGSAVIVHLDGKREMRVESDLSAVNISSSEVQKMISDETFPKVSQAYPEVTLELRGQAYQNRKFQGSAKNAMIPALLAIFAIMILQFRSIPQALIIIIMIPLGLLGAFWGHYIQDLMVTRISAFGLIALMGIVINDSIVFMDQINNNLKEGRKVFDAVAKAGRARLRPILLTTITTVVGLAPLQFESSFQAQFLIPMAVSVSFGLAFGSLFILFVMPSMVLILNDFRKLWAYAVGWVLGRDLTQITSESVEPAVIAKNQDKYFDSHGGDI